MAKVMSWDGLNLPAQNLTTNTAGPGDLTPTLVDKKGLAQYGQWNVGGGKKDWAIQQSNVKNKRSAIAFGSLGSRGEGNLNGREFQAVFYMRFADVGPFVGRRFRFFRAYDTNGKWLATLRFKDRYEVVLTEENDSISLGKITPGNWTRFEVSYNRRSGVIAARMSSTALGTWKRITMDSYNKGLKRLDRVTFGSYETDSPSWFQLRNILVNDDSYSVTTQYSPPAPPKIAVAPGEPSTKKIPQNGSTSFTTVVSQGAAPIVGRWWTVKSGTAPLPAVPIAGGVGGGGDYPMESPVKHLEGDDYAVGNYLVTFTVRDTNNYEITRSFTLVVGDPDGPPEFIVPPINDIFAGQSVLFPVAVTAGTNATSITSQSWEQISGDYGVTIQSPGSASTTVGPFEHPGAYVFRLTATNNLDLTSFADVSVEVVAPELPSPQITLPVGEVSSALTGEDIEFTATVDQGSFPVSSRFWSTTPAGGIIQGQGTLNATIRFPVEGMYSVEFGARDSLGNYVVAENRVVDVAPAIPPAVIFPEDKILNLQTETEVFVSAIVEEGTYPISTWEWELVESPENVGATLEPVGLTATIKDFTNTGFYRIQLTVTDVTGYNSSIGEFQIYAYDATVPVGPDAPVDPLDWMTNEQLRLKASQRMSGTPDGNTTQIIKRYYISVVDHPDKHHMSFHQLEREFYKGLVNGDIDVNLALYGLIDGGGALRAMDPADGEDNG